MPILHLGMFSTETGQDLRPCFLSTSFRLGRSLLLPTLPYQKTNRYALVAIIDVYYIWPGSKCMVLNPELAEYEKDMKGKGDNGPDGG